METKIHNLNQGNFNEITDLKCFLLKDRHKHAN